MIVILMLFFIVVFGFFGFGVILVMWWVFTSWSGWFFWLQLVWCSFWWVFVVCCFVFDGLCWLVGFVCGLVVLLVEAFW